MLREADSDRRSRDYETRMLTTTPSRNGNRSNRRYRFGGSRAFVSPWQRGQTSPTVNAWKTGDSSFKVFKTFRCEVTHSYGILYEKEQKR